MGLDPIRGTLINSGVSGITGLASNTLLHNNASTSQEINSFQTRGKVVLEKLRGGYVNLNAHASAVICNKTGKVTKQFTLSDFTQRVNLHSAVKPIHAGLLIELINESKRKGKNVPEFSSKEIALFSASHSGSKEYRNELRSALNKAGLDEKFMICRKHEPLRHTCSGHHASQGILSTLIDAPPEDYHEATGKTQQWLLTKLRELGQDPSIQIVENDDCNIPTFNVPLGTLAVLYAKFVSNQSFEPVTSAMTQHPALIDAISLDSKLIQRTGGNLIAKFGAEGLLVVANKKEKSALVLKEWSGDYDFTSRIAIQALKEIGWLSLEVADALFKLEDFVLEDKKHGVVYKFNSPLWI